jgi:hypothetical protein
MKHVGWRIGINEAAAEIFRKRNENQLFGS